MNIPRQSASAPALSVIVPVRDAEAALPRLCDSLYPFLDGLGRAYEVVFVEHGSRDRSATLLHQQHKLRPDVTRVLLGRGQSGEEAAILAGLGVCRGERAIILPTDLGLAPEAIAKLLARMDLGHDFVAGVRRWPGIPGWQARLTKAETWLRARLGGVRITDPDCGLSGYDRELIDLLTSDGAVPELVPALACRVARDPAEVEVEYVPTQAARSIGSWFEQAHRHLNLLLGPSRLPLRVFSVLAVGLALLALAIALLVALLGLLVAGDEALGLLLGLLLTSLVLFGLGIIGFYLDRLPGILHGKAGFPLIAHLRPKLKGEPSDD